MQLKPMQEQFAEAFVQLQQEISEEAAKAFSTQQYDPLAILHNLNKKPRLRTMKKPPLPHPTGSSWESNAGGFLRGLPLPERLVRTQQKQAEILREMESRMERATATATDTFDTKRPDFSKRRKSSRKSIWNTVMEDRVLPIHDRHKHDGSNDSHNDFDGTKNGIVSSVCSCGGSDVYSVGLSESRNQDLKKGETWGVKDRGDEVINRLQCQSCGKTWFEGA